ncbi:MAG: AAA domain-containing protein [Desulfobacterales bacterium]|nr:AAA domain-containing protein [Desulfobacterales bacterium]
MKDSDEKIPNPRELEKEIGEFLSKKFGHNVKIVSPIVMPEQFQQEEDGEIKKSGSKLDFRLKPEDLIAYLDQYIVKQDTAKAILSTKICTHFNRISRQTASNGDVADIVGSIKNNVLMMGPTGVGKTYMIKLIANRIGVPFVKGDATKFSETGYVGGDVEDLVRDLVREADDDIELAQHGIIYIDEIDKIAGSRNLIGADVSRTGVQRALLKPMEETEVDLKVPHDPISMIQEIERFRQTGSKEKQSVNTRNILFIMSGAFSGLDEIIGKRLNAKQIGFGSALQPPDESTDLLGRVTSEDLLKFGFESEFVGRLPVRAVFEYLGEEDLLAILKNPNNPIILGKKLDFGAYGIDAKFDDGALQLLAREAHGENTGARGLVSAVERALLAFERQLPSTDVKQFPVTATVISAPDTSLESIKAQSPAVQSEFEALAESEKLRIIAYLQENAQVLSEKYKVTLTEARLKLAATFYCRNVIDINQALIRIKSFYDDVKKIELEFFNKHDINIVLEEDAVDFIIEKRVLTELDLGQLYDILTDDFALGLRLVKEKTGRHRFFISRQALANAEDYVGRLLKDNLDSDSSQLPGP